MISCGMGRKSLRQQAYDWKLTSIRQTYHPNARYSHLLRSRDIPAGRSLIPVLSCLHSLASRQRLCSHDHRPNTGLLADGRADIVWYFRSLQHEINVNTLQSADEHSCISRGPKKLMYLGCGLMLLLCITSCRAAINPCFQIGNLIPVLGFLGSLQ